MQIVHEGSTMIPIVKQQAEQAPDDNVLAFPVAHSQPLTATGVPIPQAGTYHYCENKDPECELEIDAALSLIDTWRAEDLSHMSYSSQAMYVDYVRYALHRMTEEGGFTKMSFRSYTWFAARCAGLSRHTVIVYRNTNGRFCRWLAKTGRTPHIIAKYVKYPKGKTPAKLPPITPDQYALLRSAARGTVFEFLFIMGWHTGMAMIDCATLRWRQVDLDNCLVMKEREKTRSLAIVPFQKTDDFGRGILIRRALHPEAGPDDFVEPALAWYVDRKDAWGRKRTRADSLRMAIRPYTTAAKLKPGAKFHSLRRSFITALANSNTNTVLAMKMVGHSDPRMFASYVTPDVEAMRTSLIAAQANVQAKNPLVAKYENLPPIPRQELGEELANYAPRPNTLYRISFGRSLRLPGHRFTRYCLSGPETTCESKQLFYAADEHGNKLSDEKFLLSICTLSRVRK
jgi:integrase